MKIIFSFFILLFSFLSFAQEWKLKKEEDGIKIYTRLPVGSDIEEVRSTVRIKSSLTAFATLLKDVDGYVEWAYNCVEAKLIEAINDTAQIYYSHTDLLWPVSDRDLVFLFSLKQDPQTLVIKTNSYSVTEKVPLKEGIVRVRKGRTSWTITPKPGGYVEVDYYVSIDPAGSIPAWLVNSTITTGPLNTLQKVRQLLESGRYAASTFDLIRELED